MTQLRSHITDSWYRARLFVKQGAPCTIASERARIRSLDWKPSPKIKLTACMLGATRPIDRVSTRQSDPHLLSLLGWPEIIDFKNRKLAQALREIP